MENFARNRICQCTLFKFAIAVITRNELEDDGLTTLPQPRHKTLEVKVKINSSEHSKQNQIQDAAI
jgi:hypothetical protein